MELKIEGLEKIELEVNDLIDIINVEKAMDKACLLVERDAKKKAPKETGALIGSITSKVEYDGNELVGTIFTPLEYAPYVEYGTGAFAENGQGTSGYWIYVKKDAKSGHKKSTKRYPYWLAKQIVERMRAQGLDAYFTNGQHPQPFLRPALYENRGEILRILKEGIK